MTSSPLRRVVSVVIITALLAACATTSVVSEWHDPAYRGTALKKIVVFIVAADDATRRMVEDRLVSSLPKGTLGVASYTLFPDAKEVNAQNEDRIGARLAQEGFDGALTARLLSVDKDKVYVPPQSYLAPAAVGPYGSFYRYGGYAFSAVYTMPAYSYQQTKYLIETIVYEIPAGQMLWTMTTETVDPDSRQQLVDEVTRMIDGELAKQGLIAG